MYLTIVGALAGAYCAFWLGFGIIGGKTLDNVAQLIDKRDAKFKPMLVAYGCGLAISAGLLWLSPG